MDDHIFNICVVCTTEKSIDNFFNKQRERKACVFIRVFERYSDKEENKLQ